MNCLLRRGLTALIRQSGQLGRLLLILALTFQSVIAMAASCESDNHVTEAASNYSAAVDCGSADATTDSEACESEHIDDCHDCNSQCCACCVNLVQTVQLELLPQLSPDSQPVFVALTYADSPLYSLLRPPQA